MNEYAKPTRLFQINFMKLQFKVVQESKLLN